MKPPLLFYYSLFFALIIITGIVVIKLTTKYIPAYKKHRNLKKFRKKLYEGMLVRISNSSIIYKIVRINGPYVQLFYYSTGVSGHPVSTLYPVDYEF